MQAFKASCEFANHSGQFVLLRTLICESGSTYCQKWLTQASKSQRLVCNYCGPEPVSLAPKYCQEMLTQAFIASCDFAYHSGWYVLITDPNC